MTKWDVESLKHELQETDPKKLKRTAQAEKHLKNVINVRDALAKGVPEIEWTVDKVLTKRGLCIIGGSPGSYKTFFAIHLAQMVALGQPVLGTFTTRASNVLYVDEENGQIGLLNRFEALREGHRIPELPENLNSLIFAGLRLDDESDAYILRYLIEKLQVGFVVLDSMVRMMKGDEDKSKDVRKVFDNIKHILEDLNCCFVVLHHTRKDDRRSMSSIRGSGDFSGMSDSVLLMDPIPNAGKVRVEVVKSRWQDLRDIKPFQVGIEKEGENGIRLEYLGEEQEAKTRAETAAESIREYLLKQELDSFFSTSVYGNLKRNGISQNAFYAGLDLMKSAGQIKPGNKRGMYEVNFGAFPDDKAQFIPGGNKSREFETEQVLFNSSEEGKTNKPCLFLPSESIGTGKRERKNKAQNQHSVKALKEFFSQHQNKDITGEMLAEAGFSEKVIEQGTEMLTAAGDIFSKKPNIWRTL